MSLLPRKTPWSRSDAQKKAMEEQRKFIEVMLAKAKRCLETEDFKEYAAMFKRYELEMIDSIIVLNEDDPIKYAFKVRQLVDTLKAYRLFISSVQEDAQRKVDE